MLKKKLLIIGAGPVGLATALFVSSNPQIQIDIIEKVVEPRTLVGSKALAINPRTISLFKGYPIQQKLIEKSIKISKAVVRTEDKKVILENNISQNLKGLTPYTNLFIYPQCYTEQLLESQINKLDIHVQRGVEALKLQTIQDKVLVSLNTDNVPKTYDYVLAADGARSIARKSLGIKFPGETLKTILYVADYTCEDPLQIAEGVIGNQKTILFFPVKNNVIRVVTNFPDYEQKCKQFHKLIKCQWKSQFAINNRHVDKMAVGNVYLAGDAAHIHTPIGGRGMNLGIQDVFVFSHLLREGKLNEYNKLRLPVITDFVKQIQSASTIIKHEKSWTRTLLPYIGSFVFSLGKGKATQFLTGLDHQIPYLPKL